MVKRITAELLHQSYINAGYQTSHTRTKTLNLYSIARGGLPLCEATRILFHHPNFVNWPDALLRAGGYLSERRRGRRAELQPVLDSVLRSVPHSPLTPRAGPA